VEARTGAAGPGARRHVQAGLAALLLHDGGQLVHAELLRELVEHAELAPAGRVVHRDLDAANLRAAPPARAMWATTSDLI
jgi:hypothetical protein